MIVRRYNKFIVILLSGVLFFSCKDKSKFNINVSKIDLNIEINRFDLELQKLDEVNYYTEFGELRKKYPDMFQVYIEQIARAGMVKDSYYLEPMKELLFDKYTQELFADCNTVYPDLNHITTDLQNAYKHIKYYFSALQVPDFYSIVSNFGVAVASFENLMMFSLDYYLGSDYKYYDGLFPKYKYKHFSKDYLISDILKVQYSNMFPEEEFAGNTLLSKMVYQGKMLLFVDMMLPNTHDSIKIGYSREELKWCRKYEGEIWNQLLLNNVLFETQTLKISRYLDDAPFTNAYGIPTDSPARIAEWLGWQIVNHYIEKVNPTDPISIFNEKDAQKILNLSGYKPKI